MAAWTCLDLPAGRRIFRQALPADDATWSRARGWALQLGLRAAAWSVGNPVLTAIGRSTIAAVVADTRQRPAG
jgi:aminoglycoside phosphotransferase (APT) family kinase protein